MGHWGATSVAWPSGDWGSLPLEGGLEAAFKARLAGAENPEQVKAEVCWSAGDFVKPPGRGGGWGGGRRESAADLTDDVNLRIVLRGIMYSVCVRMCA